MKINLPLLRTIYGLDDCDLRPHFLCSWLMYVNFLTEVLFFLEYSIIKCKISVCTYIDCKTPVWKIKPTGGLWSIGQTVVVGQLSLSRLSLHFDEDCRRSSFFSDRQCFSSASPYLILRKIVRALCN